MDNIKHKATCIPARSNSRKAILKKIMDAHNRKFDRLVDYHRKQKKERKQIS